MMRWIIGWSLKFRLLVVAVAAGMLAFGITQLPKTPVDVLPEFTPPTVEVQTEALGLSAEEVEQQITVPLEADLLNGVAFLDEIRSESVPGLSSIELIFEPGTDIMDARQVVAERLTQATALPTGNVFSSPPQMLQPLSATNRVMMIRLSSRKLSPIQMSLLARWNIRPRLLGVPGVANVSIWGFRDRQLQVQVDPGHLRDQGVSLLQVVETAGNALWVSPLSFLEASTPGTGGFFETPNQRIGLRHVLPITTPKDLAEVAVEGEDGVRLGEVAEVVEGHQPLIGDSGREEGPGLLLVVEKFPGVNTLEVTRGVESALDTLRPGLSGMTIDSTVFRPATFIETAVENLGLTVLIGFALVILALATFFYGWRTTLISAVVIPVSLAAAGIVLYLRGATVNAMILAGLLIAIVLVVDDAVVDTHNIARRLRQHREEGNGKSTMRVILEASLEVRSAVIYATLIIVLATLPAWFMGGVSGALLPPLALSFALALAASMMAALTITPALAAMLLANAPLERRESPFVRWLHSRYDEVGPRLISMPRPVFAALAGVVLVSVAVLPFLGRSFFPSFKETDLLIEWGSAPGTSLEEMNRVLGQVSGELRGIPGVRNVGGHVGRAVLSDQIVNVNSGEVWVSIDPAADYDATVASIQDVVDGYPGLDRAVLSHEEQRLREVLTGGSDPLLVRLYGHESDVLQDKAEELKQALSEIDGIVAPHVKLDPREPTVEIQVDLAAAQRHEVRPGDVRRAAATLLSGIHVGSLFEQQKVFDVVVWGAPQTRASLTDVRELLIDTPGGHVRLGDVADVSVRPNLNVIRRESVQRFVDVAAGVSGRDFGAVVADVERSLREIDFPLEYHAEVLGGYAEQQAVQTRVLSFAVAAAIGILLLFQAAFGSWRLASLLFLVTPIALVGGVLAAFIGGGIMSLGSVVGLLAVLGIATRNCIMLIKGYQALEQQGEASGSSVVLRGTRERLVPVLMTSAATGLALLPVLFLGNIPGLELVQPMAVVVLGGLVTSSLLTLVVVPALYLRFGSSVEPGTRFEEGGEPPEELAVAAIASRDHEGQREQEREAFVEEEATVGADVVRDDVGHLDDDFAKLMSEVRDMAAEMRRVARNKTSAGPSN
jgi:CzcA family heavy metal efflux pump